MKEEKVSLHGFVSGRVQGVFFRVETRNKALGLQLAGWVRNLPDGRVEFLLSGKLKAIEAMRRWLAEGPAMARVESLDCETVNFKQYNGFEILS
jgi:acylphosphatase